MKNSEKEEVTETIAKDDVNHFNRLPDEVVLIIFAKVVDLKSLCRTSLVSTRFAAIVPQVSAISFTVPRRKPSDHHPPPDDADNLPKKVLRVVSIPFRFIRQIVGPKTVPSSISGFYGDSFRSAIIFLSKFGELRSLQMQLPATAHAGSDDDSSASLLRWRVRFGTKLESFWFLFPTSLRRFDPRDRLGRVNVDPNDQIDSELLKYRVHLAFQCLKDAVVRHRMLLFLIEQHSMLESVDITDSKKQGRIFAKAEQVAELRAWMGSSLATMGAHLRSIEVPGSAKQLYVPVMELSDSKCVMEGATLVVMRLVDRGNGSGGVGVGVGGGGVGGGGWEEEDEEVMVSGAFEESEEAFGEAVMEMMLHHKSKFKTLL